MKEISQDFLNENVESILSDILCVGEMYKVSVEGKGNVVIMEESELLILKEAMSIVINGTSK